MLCWQNNHFQKSFFSILYQERNAIQIPWLFVPMCTLFVPSHLFGSTLEYGRGCPQIHTTRNQIGNKNICVRSGNKNICDRSALYSATALSFWSVFCFLGFFFPVRKMLLNKMEFVIKATKQNLFF